MRTLPPKVHVRRHEAPTYTGTLHLPEQHVRYECTGIIESLHPDSSLAKEGYSEGQSIVFHQQYVGESVEQDVIVMPDEGVISKYVIDSNGKVVVRPRKTYLFGEWETESKEGLLYKPDGAKTKEYNNYLHVISIPLDNKFHGELRPGDSVLLPKGFNSMNQCSQFPFQGKRYMFAGIHLIGNKVTKA